MDDDGNGFVDDVHGWDFANRDADPRDDNATARTSRASIAAVGNNGIGVAGVNWRAKIVALKFPARLGRGSTADAIGAIQYAIRMHVRVLNNSWGGGPFSQALYDAVSAANDAGVVFVAAANNLGLDNDAVPQYPASFDLPNIIAVAATDRDDQLASFVRTGARRPWTWPRQTWTSIRRGRTATTSCSQAPRWRRRSSRARARSCSAPSRDGRAAARARVPATADRLPWLAGRVSSGAGSIRARRRRPDIDPARAIADPRPRTRA